MNGLVDVKRLRRAMAGAALCASTVASSAIITVNVLTDDIFPDATGALFDINGSPVVLGQPKCTLRMAISSANLDPAVPITNGCAAGSGADTIDFAASLNLTTTPGTIMLADKGMSEAPATYSPAPAIYPALIASRQLTITGPGSAFLTIDGSVAGASGRRLLNASDGEPTVDRPFSISGLRLLRGRTIDSSSGCMFSAESTTISDVIFESCESVGGPTAEGFGGALGVGNTNTAGNYRPAVTISNTQFVSNRATRGTGATRSEVGAAFFGSATRMVGAVSLTKVRLLGNAAEQAGGMFINDASSVLITQSQFLSNAATGSLNTVTPGLSGGRYGGLTVSNVGAGGVTMSDAAFIGNTANWERAGFSVRTVGGPTSISGGTVRGNTAINARIGGFEVLTDAFDAGGNCTGTSLFPVSVTDMEIKANLAATNTAGFRVQCSGAVSISNSAIEGNEVFGSQVAGSGGNAAGQINSNQMVTMTNVRVIGNKTFAGAVDGGFSVMTVQDNTGFDGSGLFFRDNYAQKTEGALTLRPNVSTRNYTLSNSAFVDNRADTNFSALLLDKSGNYAVRNTTFSGNSSSTGGAIFVNMNAPAGAPTVLFENVTSARQTGGNLALEAGSFGAPNTPGGTLTVTNTILGSGTSGIGVASSNFQTIAGVSYAITNSLIENNSFGVPAGVCGVNGTLCGVSARLEAVAANGGFPTLTHALKPGSPALDSGSNAAASAAFDQRGTGFPRIVNGTVDMGAFESPVLAPPCTLDVDGSGGAPDALTDGLLMIRAMFGLTGTSVTTGATAVGAPRNNWTLIRAYLNGSCGANFGP